jgi:hypothetical protein
MSERLTDKVFKMKWDLNRFYGTGFEHDLRFISSTATKDIGDVAGITQYTRTPFLVFENLNDAYTKTDYPYASNHLPIISKRFVDALEKMQSLDFWLIQIYIVNRKAGDESEFFYTNESLLKDRSISEDFFLLQLSSLTDAFNKDLSIYKPGFIDPSAIGPVTEFIFRDDVSLPPIFRIPEKINDLFITSEARKILAENKISGIQYESLKFYLPYSNIFEIDHPVQL